MSYLGYSDDELQKMGALFTASEICQQPELWQKIWLQVKDLQNEIQSFLADTTDIEKIILTGAGTSAFVGLSTQGSFQRNLGITSDAVSTTDLVSHPRDYFQKESPILLVSFARSGNSPESVAALQLADKLTDKCYHLIITCSADGELANYQSKNKKYVFLLPPEANDQSLAMTSSYTGMLLAALLISRIDYIEQMKSQVDKLCLYGKKAIFHYSDSLQKIACLNFKRAVFLGSGPQLGTATEGHLKLQELTDGKVICKHDSYLGFRHGPKAVVDSDTLVVYLLSNDPHVLKYEIDLIKSMRKGNNVMAEVGVMESKLVGFELDVSMVLSENGSKIDEEFLTVCNILPAQILGFYKSIDLGFSPDKPSASGSISRVVEGVNIYSE